MSDLVGIILKTNKLSSVHDVQKIENKFYFC